MWAAFCRSRGGSRALTSAKPGRSAADGRLPRLRWIRVAHQLADMRRRSVVGSHDRGPDSCENFPYGFQAGRSGETLRAWAPPAALRPCRATAASAREPSPRPAAAGRRNGQRQVRELQKRPSSRRSIVKPGKITSKGASRHT